MGNKFSTPKLTLSNARKLKNVLNSKYFNNSNIYILTSEAKNNKSLIRHIKKKYLINILIGSEENVFSRYLKLKNIKKFA